MKFLLVKRWRLWPARLLLEESLPAALVWLRNNNHFGSDAAVNDMPFRLALGQRRKKCEKPH